MHIAIDTFRQAKSDVPRTESHPSERVGHPAIDKMTKALVQTHLAIVFLFCSLLMNCSCKGPLARTRIAIDYVDGTTEVDDSISTLVDGRIVRRRPRTRSDQLRHTWIYSSYENWKYSDTVLATVYAYLQEKLNVSRNSFGRRGFLPGMVIVGSKNSKTQDVLVTFDGHVPVAADPNMPGIPVSGFGTRSLYLFSGSDSSVKFLADDDEQLPLKNRDEDDSLFRGMGSELFDESGQRVFFSVSGRARSYDLKNDILTKLDHFDYISSIEHSDRLLAYSFDSGAYTLLTNDFEIIRTTKGPPALEITSAFCVDSDQVVIHMIPRSGPAFTSQCFVLNFSSKDFQHLLDINGGEILDARIVVR